MKKLFFALMLFVMGFSFSTFAADKFEPVGVFSNMRYTEEHAYGYTVELWKLGDKYYGLFLDSDGLQGDTPTGQIQVVKYDPASGDFSFSAKLSMGSVYVKGGTQIPGKYLFQFKGKLKPSVLSGGLETQDVTTGKPEIKNEKIKLHKQKKADMSVSSTSFAQWEKDVSELLKIRGPKW